MTQVAACLGYVTLRNASQQGVWLGVRAIICDNCCAVWSLTCKAASTLTSFVSQASGLSAWSVLGDPVICL
eukprot:3383112-Amphidinium_carterae.1